MTDPILIGTLAHGARAFAVPGPDGWGIAVEAPGRASARQPHPVCAEVVREVGEEEAVTRLACGYGEVAQLGGGMEGHARLELGGAALVVRDQWTVDGQVLEVARRVRVEGTAPGGFLTSITLAFETPLDWPDVDAFAPGMIYGWSENIARHAIGGVSNYLAGARAVRVREDRLPAPLFGLSLRDGTTLAVLNPAPDGGTTPEDGRDLEGRTLTDARFRFAALGGERRGERLEVGLTYPGSEGDVTYLADTPFSDGQFGNNLRRSARRRLHPLEDGFEQGYRAAFRFGAFEDDRTFRRRAWRWAWSVLKPQVAAQDLRAAETALSDALEASIETVEGRAAPAHVVDSLSRRSYGAPAMMGFTGRAVETGELLLRSSYALGGEAGARRRARALAVLETFARLPVSPPQAEGLDLKDGRLTSGVRPDFYLRALAEGGLYMLRAYEEERERGTPHPHWLTWCVGLADWLLTQELPTGGFPRSWRDHTAVVVLSDPRSSNAVVPFFVQLTRVTGEQRYLEVALRAAELCWALDGCRGFFVGGTLDNANVVDKEAGTLALAAYLALHEVTGDRRWLARAQVAADFAETWIYVWNVPMPEGEVDAELHWKRGVTTVGAQLIATGHSLTDQYMAWDVANYAALAQLTGDEHYLEVARLLLHNTKTMLALPGRTFDLVGPGWQQEHWSFAPPRGRGQHRHWLPWVACSHLEGLYSLRELDPDLYETLASGSPQEAPA